MRSSASSKKRPKKVEKQQQQKKAQVEENSAEVSALVNKEEDQMRKSEEKDTHRIQDDKMSPKSHQAVEIVIKKTSAEDRFVERWSTFDWPGRLAEIPLANLSAVIKQVNEHVNSVMKKSRYEVKFEVFMKQKEFLATLAASMTTQSQPNITFETFSSDSDVTLFAQQCCWMQIFTKSTLFPSIDPANVIYFRSDLQPIQINLTD